MSKGFILRVALSVRPVSLMRIMSGQYVLWSESFVVPAIDVVMDDYDFVTVGWILANQK